MKASLIFRTKLMSIYGLLVCMIFACTNSLMEEPKGSVTPDNYYTTPAQIESSFAAAMHFLWSYWGGYGYAMSTFSNDDQMRGGNLVIPLNWGSGLWRNHYRAILNLNASIRAIENGALDGASASELDLLMGQAKFLRAYNYFMLVRMFGGVPLITENTENPIQANVERYSVQDVYDLIVSDFEIAIANLPQLWPTSRQGRPTADVARGLLAKTYLTMATFPLDNPEYYQKAADMASQVIQNGNYHLVKDINDVFSTATKYGPEMMWSYNSNYQYITTDAQIWTDMDGWGDVSADLSWVEEYPDQPRKYAYIQITSREGDHYIEVGRSPGIQKFLYDKLDDFSSYRSIVNMPIIRYADVLLTFAEAENMAQGHPTQAAVDAINQVISRANGYNSNAEYPLASVNMSQEEFDEKVIQERNYELCFEYDRWFDLIRKHILKEKSDSTIQQNFSESDYLFPIPSDDIRLNPSLTQNPGY